MGSRNEHINLWILAQERERDRERIRKEKAQRKQMDKAEGKNHCSKCKKAFDDPKLVPVCPHCLNRIEEKVKAGCQYWLGYLSQKDKAESVPQECVECEKVMDCMLNQEHSPVAVLEISKWY